MKNRDTTSKLVKSLKLGSKREFITSDDEIEQWEKGFFEFIKSRMSEEAKTKRRISQKYGAIGGAMTRELVRKGRSVP